MVWKKDLQKLKQSMGAEDSAPPKPVPPPKPKPAEFKPIEEEDEMFLSAMGHRPQPRAPKAIAEPAPAPRPQAPQPEPPGLEFAAAMGDLKGLVPLRAVEAAPPEAPPAPAPVPAPVVAAPPPPPEPAPESLPEPAPEPPAALPVQINLAAGMAIEVDGSLDLKGHSRNDGEERLKERVLDGYALGWRTLHVILGPSQELREMLMDLLKAGPGTPIARYAQAPIPMGGNQAWILYFRSTPAPADNS